MPERQSAYRRHHSKETDLLHVVPDIMNVFLVWMKACATIASSSTPTKLDVVWCPGDLPGHQTTTDESKHSRHPPLVQVGSMLIGCK